MPIQLLALLFLILRTDAKVPIKRTQCYTKNGLDYAGAIDKTVSNRTCVLWSDPRLFGGGRNVYHSVIIENLKQHDGTADHNYCRNPSPEPFSRPFCFLQLGIPNPPFAYCDLPRCEDYNADTSLYCYKNKGENYRGRIDRSASGRACMNWHTPLKVVKDDPYRQRNLMELVKNEKDYKHNFCRNPDPANRTRPWCYLADDYENIRDLRWEYCSITRCEKVCKEMPLICENKGTCVADDYDFECQCLEPYHGQLCQYGDGVTGGEDGVNVDPTPGKRKGEDNDNTRNNVIVRPPPAAVSNTSSSGGVIEYIEDEFLAVHWVLITLAVACLLLLLILFIIIVLTPCCCAEQCNCPQWWHKGSIHPSRDLEANGAAAIVQNPRLYNVQPPQTVQLSGANRGNGNDLPNEIVEEGGGEAG